jgi:hypothetical protein
MKVVLSKRADLQAERIDAWWREHRPAAPDLFERTLSELVTLLATSGVTLGRPRRARNGKLLYRVLMEKTEHHAYIRRDSPTLLTIVCFWGARRGREPRL